MHAFPKKVSDTEYKAHNQIKQMLTMKNGTDPIKSMPYKMGVVILGGSTTPSSTRTDVHTTVTAVTHTATETTITAAPPLHGAKGTGKQDTIIRN